MFPKSTYEFNYIAVKFQWRFEKLITYLRKKGMNLEISSPKFSQEDNGNHSIKLLDISITYKTRVIQTFKECGIRTG